MENLIIKKERVIEAADKCSTAKGILKVLFPEVFEQKFKSGDYIKGPFFEIRRIVKCRVVGVMLEWSEVEECGYNHSYPLSNIELATPSEIEKHLIALAEKKGFKEGVNIKILIGNKKGEKANNSLSGALFYIANSDELVYSGDMEYTIYCNGEWAEIIEKPKTIEITIEEIAKLKGVDVSQIKIIK